MAVLRGGLSAYGRRGSRPLSLHRKFKRYIVKRECPQQAKTTLESNADMRPRRELPKAYDPAAIEERWAAYWVEQRLFEVKTPVGSHERAFTVLLPRPTSPAISIWGTCSSTQSRTSSSDGIGMLGETTLWLPGTDHAGIATQMLVERLLVSESTSRQALGREAFVERVRQWRRYYGGAILASMKRIGDTVDWSREYYTMDDNLSVAVREAFVRLYEDGLIYRGAYIVNWCPRCQTAISDLESRTRSSRQALGNSLPRRRRARRIPHRRHHPPRNHARRRRCRRESPRRALHASPRQDAQAAPHRPRDSRHRRRLG